MALVLNLPLLAWNVKKYVCPSLKARPIRTLISNRIVDNAHLLDATEIFRKLNVHKRVSNEADRSTMALN